MIFQTEKQFKEFGDKVPADKKAPIESALAKLKEAHKNQDIPSIDKAMEELNAAWTAASEEIYKAQAAGGAQPQDGGHQGEAPQDSNETVTDAEFEEVK